VMNRTAAARPSYVPSGTIGTPPLDPGSASSTAAGGATSHALGTGGNAIGGITNKENPNSSPFRSFGTGSTGKPSIPPWQVAAARANSTPPTAAGGASANVNGSSAGGASSTTGKPEGTDATAP